MPADVRWHARHPATAAASVIHDLGYRRYDGPRLGRAQIVRALAWHSFRAAFGFGRGAKAKIVPAVALVALCLPAVVNAFAMSGATRGWSTTTPTTPALRDLVMTIFVAVQAPELGVKGPAQPGAPAVLRPPHQDDRLPAGQVPRVHRRLPGDDGGPAALLYGGSIANVHGGAAVWAQTRALIPGLLVGLMWAVVLAAISLFLASLTGRRAFATGAVAIFFLLTFTLAEILLQVEAPAESPQAQVVKARARSKVDVQPVAISATEPGGQGLRPVQPVHPVRRRAHVARRHRPGSTRVPNPGAFGAVYALVLWPSRAVPGRPGRPLPEGARCHDRHPDQERQPLVRQRRRGQRHHAWTSGPASPACSARTARASPRSCT